MENALILETTFLIDFERERKTGMGKAMDFLKARPETRLYITHTIAGELACGNSLGFRKKWQDFIEPFQVLAWTTEVDWHYGRIFRYLQNQGMMIGANDLWIAATALAYDSPLVSANMEHYGRIPDLELEAYK